jgi:DNA-binding transcriptional LysR family regulator
MFHASLRALDEVARSGSIRKASTALGTAPSSVSRSIALLEREMGTALLERSAQGVSLTHAGRLVADYARSALMDYDSLRADLDDARGTQRKLIRLTLVEGVAAFGPSGAVATLLRRFPATTFNIRLLPAPQVFEAVRQARCDIGIAFCAEPDPEILTLASVPEPIVLALHASHPLAALSKIGLCELSALALALPDADFGIRRIFDRACAAAGVQVRTVLAGNDFETLRGFATSAGGGAILPRRAVRLGRERAPLKAIPLVGAAFGDSTIDVIVLRKRRLPRIVRAFAEVLIEEIRSAA